jgi:hypothetical protein
LRSLCDGDHKNAHFVVAPLGVPSTEIPRYAHPPVVTSSGGRLARCANRRQVGLLRKKKSPALVSGAEDDDRSSFLHNQAIPIRAMGSSKRLL